MFTDYDLSSTDEENAEFIFYDNRMSISVNTTISISKIVDDVNKPIQISCPYKYAVNCDEILDDLCSDGYVARYTDYAQWGIEWRCMDIDVLTDDLLNYRMDPSDWDYENQISRRRYLSSSAAEGIVEQCKLDYIVDNIDAECYVNDVVYNDMTQVTFKANDKIRCSLKMYNTNGDEVYFDNLLWSIELKMVSDDYSFYPIAGQNNRANR